MDSRLARERQTNMTHCPQRLEEGREAEQKDVKVDRREGAGALHQRPEFFLKKPAVL